MVTGSFVIRFYTDSILLVCLLSDSKKGWKTCSLYLPETEMISLTYGVLKFYGFKEKLRLTLRFSDDFWYFQGDQKGTLGRKGLILIFLSIHKIQNSIPQTNYVTQMLENDSDNNPACIYLLKVNNRNNRTRFDMFRVNNNPNFNPTWENGKETNFGPDFGPFLPKFGLQRFFHGFYF